MTKDIRKNIDATAKLNESLEESPIGWAGNKLAKVGGRLASKSTWGGTKQKLKKGVDIRSQAEQHLTVWNTEFAARKMQRTPMNIIKFMSKHMKISREQLKTAWNSTPQLIKRYGTYDEVVNQLKGVTPRAEQPGERRQPQSPRERAAPPISGANYGESLDERNLWTDTSTNMGKKTSGVPATQKMSVDVLRKLIINALDVKNKDEAEQAVGDMPMGDDPDMMDMPGAEQPKDKPFHPDEYADEPRPEPKPTVKDLKKGGAKDMDGDDDYDWNDVAKTAVAQGKSDEALSALLKAIDPDVASLVKQVIKSTSKGR